MFSIICADYQQMSNESLPLKWMAPESIRNKIYTSQSDCWSFGILMWEITSLGAQPYGDRDALEAARCIIGRKKLDMPSGCPSRLYSLMCRCWEYKPADRPSFDEVYDELASLVTPNKRSSSVSQFASNQGFYNETEQVYLLLFSLFNVFILIYF